MKKTKKALASLAIVGMVATMVPFNAFAATGVTTDRLSGADRFATAVQVADKFVSATTAILAPAGDANLVDALAAAPLAGKNSPILLTDSKVLTAATKAELVKLGVTKVYVVGAIDQAVLTEVDAMTGVEAIQLKGADRIATAVAISSKLTNPAGSFVVGYDALVDALSVASWAAENNYSILVANQDGSLPASEAAYLGAKVYLVGSSALVDDIAGATRLSGTDRFATNKAVLDTLDFSYNNVYVANGTEGHLVDSLVASSLAAKSGAPIVLTDTATGGDATAAAIGPKLAAGAVVVALGGPTVVSNATLAKVTNAVPGILAVSSVSAVNSVTIAVKFNKVVDESTAEDETNYLFTEVGGAELEFTGAELQSDKSTVYLTLDEAVAALNDSSTNYTVEISDVLDTNGGEMDDDFTDVISLSDQTRPTVTSSSFTDSDTMKVVFSEPVDNLSDSFIKVYDGYDEVTDVDVTADVDNEYAEITGLSALDEDTTYTLRVFSGVQDWSGNIITPNPYEKNFTVSEDNSDPKVSSIANINLRTFKVVFSEPIDADLLFEVDVINSDGAVIDTIEVVDDTNNKEWTVTLTEDVSAGLHKVTITDFYDNSGNPEEDDSSYIKYVKFSNNHPSVTSTTGAIRTIGGLKYVVFTFDQDIDTLNPDVIEFTRTDSDDITYDETFAAGDFLVDADESSLADDELAIALDAFDEGSYELTLPAGFVESYGADSSEVDLTFKYSTSTSDVTVDKDLTLPVGAGVAINGDAATESLSKIVVVFSDEVGNSALDVSNYTVDGSRVFSSAVFLGDKMTVRLTMNTSGVRFNGNYVFAIKNIKDENGNAVDSFTETTYFKENVKPTIVKAEIVELNTIEATFNEVIANEGDLNLDDFVVTVNGSEVDIASATLLDGTKLVTIVLEDDITDLDAVVKVKTSSDFDGKDAAGNTGVVGSEKTAVWAD